MSAREADDRDIERLLEVVSRFEPEIVYLCHHRCGRRVATPTGVCIRCANPSWGSAGTLGYWQPPLPHTRPAGEAS